MDASSSSSHQQANYTAAYARARPMVQKHRSAASSNVIYGSQEGPREVDHPCCVLARLCLQALTG
ncbi:hypothetical protein BGX29_007534 [Mortierella sp. GBA35]|nr:hypothetical protein BGX29_007534 [Mortierella sp. GBA35]